MVNTQDIKLSNVILCLTSQQIITYDDTILMFAIKYYVHKFVKHNIALLNFMILMITIKCYVHKLVKLAKHNIVLFDFKL